MGKQITEPVPHAAAITDRALIVEEHPLFPEWLAAFEHLIKAHERAKAGEAHPLRSTYRKSSQRQRLPTSNSQMN